ncbi:MAG: hypothetical protein ABI833_12965 [Acidobacteriota bacterium]
MNKIMLAIAYVGIAAGSATAADQTFGRTKIPDAKGKHTSVGLVFRDSRNALEVRAAGQVIAQIPYSSIHELSYEHTQKHRITQGAVVMVASLGAGAVVMLTKSKSHFLTVEYDDGTAFKELVLRMDKSEYRGILATAKLQTGKNVTLVR